MVLHRPCLLAVVLGCSSSSTPQASRDAAVAPVIPPESRPVVDRVSSGVTPFGPSYTSYPAPASPPLAWLAPGDCLALRVDAADVGIRVQLTTDDVHGWTATVGPPGAEAPLALTAVSAGVLEGVVPGTSATELRITAIRPDCGPSRIVTLRQLDDGTVAVVGYSSVDCRGNGGARSRRAYKADIAYVTAAERAALRDELMQLRLARYRYKTGPATRRLGVILDDVLATGAPIALDDDSIDLYAYSSLAIATAQEQQRELDELRARVQVLEAALRMR